MENDESSRPEAIGSLFTATRWSVVLKARDNSKAALNTLCQSYRQPLIIWLRTRGFSVHDAEDITHGLFLQLLERDFLKNVAAENGRFRSFLLRCLKNYLADEHARKGTARRGGRQKHESLDATDERDHKPIDPPDQNALPDVAFDRAWATNLFETAILRLREECERQGHSKLYHELEPKMFKDETASGFREISVRLGMTEAAVKMAASRIRARFKGLVREEIMQTVTNEQDLHVEVKYLMELFAHK